MDAPFPPEMMPEIERFFREDHPVNVYLKTEHPSTLIYDTVFKSSLFFPLQRQRELHHMLHTADEISPKVVMEIGADKGGGLYHWCMLPSVRHVFACEIRGLPYARQFEKTFPHIEFTWLDGSSYEPRMVAYVKRTLAISAHKSIDVLFIDGDKRKFLTDFDLYYPMMSKPGLVFMHDINSDNASDHYDTNTPRGAFESLKRNRYHCSEYLNRTDSIEADKRAKAGEPVANPHEGWLRFWKGRSCGVGIVRLS